MTSIRKVLVLGASGDQGLPLLDALQAAGFETTAGVRRPDAMRDTRHATVATVPLAAHVLRFRIGSGDVRVTAR